MTAIPPGRRVGYQCLRSNDDCPGHTSKWMLCDGPLYTVGGTDVVSLRQPPRPAVFGVDWTVADPQPWQEIEIDGAVWHHDPLRGWQASPAPEVHHRACRQPTDDERKFLATLRRPVQCPARSPESDSPCALPDVPEAHRKGHESYRTAGSRAVWATTEADRQRWAAGPVRNALVGIEADRG